jgi:hypothetical protein
VWWRTARLQRVTPFARAVHAALQDSPCATPSEGRSLEGQSAFEGFTYCEPSFLAVAAARVAAAAAAAAAAVPPPIAE